MVLPAVLFVCGFSCCGMNVCQAADRVALVIGNSRYAGDAVLQNPSNDVDLLEGALRELNFSVTKKKDLTLKQMQDALVDFQKRLPKGSLGLFYYAGHGLQVNGENYLVPIGAQIRNESEVKRQCLPADQVLDTMDESDSNLKVLILDCCRNNPFKRGWKRSLADHGLAAMSETPEGTIIAYSTAPKKTADDGDGKNSPYAEHLAATLRSRPTGSLELKDVFFKSSQLVKRATGQQPWLNMEASVEDYYLRPAPDLGTGLANRPASHGDLGGNTFLPKVHGKALVDGHEISLDSLWLLPLHVQRLGKDWFVVVGQNARVKKSDVVALDQAAIYYSECIGQDAASGAIARSYRGVARALSGSFDSAAGDCEEAIRLAPESAVAHKNRSFVLREKGDLQKALVEIDHALRLDPKLVVARFGHRGTGASCTLER